MIDLSWKVLFEQIEAKNWQIYWGQCTCSSIHNSFRFEVDELKFVDISNENWTLLCWFWGKKSKKSLKNKKIIQVNLLKLHFVLNYCDTFLKRNPCELIDQFRVSFLENNACCNIFMHKRHICHELNSKLHCSKVSSKTINFLNADWKFHFLWKIFSIKSSSSCYRYCLRNALQPWLIFQKMPILLKENAWSWKLPSCSFFVTWRPKWEALNAFRHEKKHRVYTWKFLLVIVYIKWLILLLIKVL